MSFGKRLRDSRIAKKLTQAEVARRLGMDDTTISKYENDKSQPDNEILKLLAKMYEVSFDFLHLGRSSNILEYPITEQDSRVLDGFHMLDEDERKHIENSIEMLIKKRFK